jgi:thioredoxin-related protein
MVFFAFCSKRSDRIRHWHRTACFIAVLFSIFVAKAVDAAELIMFEAPGCEYCALWNEEVGDIYAGTDMGKLVPLRRVQMDEKWPQELRQIKPVRYSPTFVVFENGQELGRITGYPGEAFFWGYLDQIVAKVDRQ